MEIYDALKLFAKDFRHLPKSSDLEFANLMLKTQETVRGNTHHVGKLLQVAALSAHREEGAQMWVSKQVSDDLLRSVIPEPEFETIQWPAQSLEVVFEDPRLPTLFARNAGTDLSGYVARRARALGDKAQWLSDSIQFMRGVDDRIQISLYLRHSVGAFDLVTNMRTLKEMDDFASGEYNTTERDVIAGGSETSKMSEGAQEIDEAVRQMSLLFYKVLLFASTPKFGTRQEAHNFPRKMGGKPGHLDRPKLVRHIVEYLPKFIAEKKQEAARLGQSKTFRGRLGHFRTYKSERYVNMQGRREYMWPIPDPLGGDLTKKFVVRRPRA